MQWVEIAKATGARLVVAFAVGLLAACASEPVERPAAFGPCLACHKMQAGKHGVGPSLVGIVGTKAGTQDGYRYSDALRNADITWTEDNLQAFLTNPKKFIPGNKMPFAGLRRPEDVQAVIAYLKFPAPDRPVAGALVAFPGPAGPVVQTRPPAPAMPDEALRSMNEVAAAFKSRFSNDREGDQNQRRLAALGGNLAEAFSIIRRDHVSPINDAAVIAAARTALAEAAAETEPTAVMERMIGKMAESLGSGSNYWSSRNNTMVDATRKQSLQGGIGVELKSEAGLAVINEVVAGAPADKAGLRRGDRLVSVDGRSVKDRDVIAVIDGLNGEPGTEVAIAVDRPDQAARDLRLVRAKVPATTVSALVDGAVGYVRITKFLSATGNEVKEAVARLKREAKTPLQGYVLDLRHNSGGLLDQVIAVADNFLEQGVIVRIRSRRAEDSQTYNARPGDLADGAPIVALIDGQTAGGAEFVAAALRDNGRAKLVGARSFGRGTVQTMIPLAGFGALSLTTGQFISPSERLIQGTGVEPDIKAAWDAAAFEALEGSMIGRRETDPQYARAVAVLAELAQSGTAKPGLPR